MRYAKEHGDYSVSLSLQTIMLSARGPWNDESLLLGGKAMRKNIGQLDLNKPWGCLSCLYGESLMPPSAYEAFEKHTVIRKNLGVNGLAVVIKDSDIAFTIKSQLTKAYQAAGVEFEFFSEIESAITWLNDKGVNLDKAQVLQFFQQHSYTQQYDS